MSMRQGSASFATLSHLTIVLVTLVTTALAQTWEIEVVDAAGNVGDYSSLALDGSGYAHIGYSDNTDTSLNYAYEDATGWHIQTVDGIGFRHYGVSLALDGLGYPHIGYYRWYSNSNLADLKYAYEDAAGWHIETVDAVGDYSLYGYGSIALDASGCPHISYFDYTNDDLNYAYKDATGWHIQTVAPEWGTQSWLALDSSGYPHICHSNDGSLGYAYEDATGWHFQIVDDPTQYYSGTWSSLALDASDYPHISYCDEYFHCLRYAYQDGEGWHLEEVGNEGESMWGTSIALDGSGHPQIGCYAWYPTYDLKFSYKDATGWHVQTVDSEGDVGYTPSLALDGAGNPHISYHDATNDDLKYAFCSLPTIAHIEAAYSVGGPFVVVGTVERALTVPMGDLTVSGNYGQAVWMPGTDDGYSTSRTFIMRGWLSNNGLTVQPILETDPFIVRSGNHLNMTYRWRILDTDSNTSNNTTQGDVEVWRADFGYGHDNYSFPNYQASLADVGYIMVSGINHFMIGCPGYLVGKGLLNLLAAIAAANGHCYGFSASSVLYVENPDWLPGNASYTYQLNGTDPAVKLRIAKAFAMQFGAVAEMIFRDIAYSGATNALNALNATKQLLLTNQLVNACYDHHATVTHTMIRNGSKYNLFEYDSNPSWFQYAPHQRGAFIQGPTGDITLEGQTDNFLFEHPDFDLRDRDAAFDSLMAWELDSLQVVGVNVLVYKENSYDPEDPLPVATVAISSGVVDSLDFGGYEVFYLSNTVQPDVSFTANRPGSFSVMGLAPSRDGSRSGTQFIFNNLALPSGAASASITSVFQAGDQVCSIDTDGDGTDDTDIPNSYNGDIVTLDNLPPSLVDEMPIVQFAMNIGSIQLDLLDYVADESPAALVFDLAGIPAPVSAAIQDTMLNLTLLEPFEGVLNLTLQVSDGTNNITMPLFMQYSPCFYFDYDIPPPGQPAIGQLVPQSHARQ